MAADRRAPNTVEELQRLTKREIDRQISHVIARVAGADGPMKEGADELRWITPADLVRRMQPFIGQN